MANCYNAVGIYDLGSLWKIMLCIFLSLFFFLLEGVGHPQGATYRRDVLLDHKLCSPLAFPIPVHEASTVNLKENYWV